VAPKNLDKIAQLRVGKPKNPTPPPNPGDDWDKIFEDALKTTTTTTPPTTTTVPQTPTTTAPKTTGGTSGGRRKITTVREAERLLQGQQRRGAVVGLTQNEIDKVQEGKKPGGFWGAVSSVVNFDVIPGDREFRPIARGVLPSLGALQTGGRAILAANEEAIDRVNQFIGRAPKYTATDYIPVHKQTGVPIAKPGDFYVRNWTDVINAPVNLPANATPEQKVKATADLVKSKGRTSSGSAKEVIKAAQDFTYSASDNPYIPETGNKYIDGVIDFGYDVLLDPVTYATAGGSAVVTPIREGLEGATRAGASAAARQTARVAEEAAAAKAAREASAAATAKILADDAAAKAAKIAADEAADEAAKAAAQKAAEAAAARATKRQAAAEAAARAAENTAKAADTAFRKAAAAAPRRVYGRSARETLADQVRVIRQQAQTVLDDAAASAAEKVVAKQAVDVLTNDFIKQVAARGYSVIRGEAAKTLGVRSGVRIGLPGFGKATIPYTSVLTDFVGSSLSKGRYAFFQTKAGQAVLNSITPVGEGGLFGSEALLKMRTALRNGSATPEEAVDYTALLGADEFYRGSLNLARRKAAADVSLVTRGKAKRIMKDIADHLATPEADWAAKGLRALSASEQAVYDSVKKTLNTFYREANSAASIVGAGPLTGLTDYWPRSQSQQAIEWAAKNADEAEKIATGLGVDRTFFLGNFTNRTLAPGKVWFGEVLDGTETIYDLNRIAKESGLIDFDFFETDPVRALSNYADTHAKYLAYSTAIDRLTRQSPAAAGGLAEDISMKTPGVLPASKPSVTELGSLENTIANFMTADRLANWSESQILAVRDAIIDLRSELAGSSDIVKREFTDAIMEIDEKIASTTRLINAGVIDPTAGSLLRAELETYANGLALSISNAKREFIVTNPGRWKNVGRVLEDGFVVLNEKTIPDIAVRESVAEFFTNVKRLDDPAFARAAEAVLKDYNTFFKSAVTTTLGFHTRNAISNTFTMLAAGADPVNLLRGRKIYSEWRKANKRGISPENFIKGGLRMGIIRDGEEAAVREALAFSGATGFGQFGEIAAEAGLGRPGVFGQEATGRIPFTKKEVPGLKKASEILGTPFYGSRKLGSLIEDFNRFQLTFDGVKQGYNPATAAARTRKFLIDYNDLSTADRAIKQIVPFWIWTTRNMPLQIENMWLNPKAYTTYDKFKNNLEDEEGTSPYLPDYLKEAGAFKLPGTDFYLRPDLGFPGAGQPNPLQMIMEGEGLQALSAITPALRIPIENAVNQKFFSGAKIGGALDQFSYTVQQGVPGLSTIGRLLTAVPGTEPEIVQTLTGAKADETERGILSFIGSPAFRLLESQERSEVWRRYFLLKEYIDGVLEKRREENRGG